MFNEDYVTFPRDDIAKLSGLSMPVNKRNWSCLLYTSHLAFWGGSSIGVWGDSGLFAEPGTVSYTHLDVYKRQAQNGGFLPTLTVVAIPVIFKSIPGSC